MSQKILMLGWELPPHNSGGLGVACLGLCKALSSKGAEITFVMPRKLDLDYDFMKLLFANVRSKGDISNAYISSKVYNEYIDDFESGLTDYVSASLEYAKKIGAIVKKLNIDLIHAHDWMTYPAALVAKELTGKPLITHIHSTEVDRTGGHNPNSIVYSIEKNGLEKADKVISVSKFTKQILVDNYGVAENKIDVVYNGVDTTPIKKLPPSLTEFKKLGYKIVVNHGRITLQKGPEYFIRAAKKVLEYNPKVMFVVSGSGDMEGNMMQEACNLGITRNVVFTGALWGEEKDRIFQSADVYVMPSVSEPFGIVPLEAIANGTPVIISKQSGVSEILKNVLKVDFWDTDEIANKILAVLEHRPLKEDLIKESGKELPNINWDKAADKCLGLYSSYL